LLALQSLPRLNESRSLHGPEAIRLNRRSKFYASFYIVRRFVSRPLLLLHRASSGVRPHNALSRGQALAIVIARFGKKETRRER